MSRAAKPYDDRPDQAKRLAQARVDRGFKTAKEATEFFSWNYTTYSQHERGLTGLRPDVAKKYAQAYRVSTGWLITGEGTIHDRYKVQIIGKIGEKGEIEQSTPDAFYDMHSLLPLPLGAIGFEISGRGLYPRYDPGDAIVCLKDGVPLDDFDDGEEAVVRLEDGHRFLKRLWRTNEPSRFDLEGYGVGMMRNVRVEWASYVLVTISRSKARRAAKVDQRPSIDAAVTRRPG